MEDAAPDQRAEIEIPIAPGGQAQVGAPIHPEAAPENPPIDAPANPAPPLGPIHQAAGQPQVAGQPQLAGQPQMAMFWPAAQNIVQAAGAQGPGQIVIQHDPDVLEMVPDLAVVGQKQVVSKSQQDMIRRAPFLNTDSNSRNRERAQNSLRIAAIRVECGEQNFIKK